MTKSKEDGTSSHSLSRARHQEIRAQHKAEVVDALPEAKQPTVVILAGQPGAGKSALRAQALRDFPVNEPPVEVDIDELRKSHDDYDRLSVENNRSAASHVQDDAGRWGDELIEDAREGRRNVIIDGTLKSPEKAAVLCERFKKDGYRVEVRAMAVRYEDSQLGVHKRYHQAKANGKQGRWVPEPIHDQAYSGIEESLQRLHKSESVDRIEVHGRTLDGSRGTRLLSAGGPGESDPVSALNAERTRPRTVEEQASYEYDMQAVRDMILEQDKDLKEPENQIFFERVQELELNQTRIPRTDGSRPASSEVNFGTQGKTTRRVQAEWDELDKSAGMEIGPRSTGTGIDKGDRRGLGPQSDLAKSR
ncbi:zeta toxin family protein [Seohaeicola saemankumensis]|nr:zeta toxin family protein [Seohaeicola saemankumensis]MCA0871430.1 zeta toxin family protein [Seohaeicola saemankumensis]